MLTCLLIISTNAYSSSLKIMAEEYPPYSYQQEGKARGLFIDLVRNIQEMLDEEPSGVTFYPWARGYKRLEYGSGDILMPMCMTPERSLKFKFVGPVFWDDIYFYRRKGSGVELDNVDDARKVHMITVTRDDILHQNLVSMGYTNLDLSASTKCDFMKLIRGRADLVPMGRKVISYFFKCNPELDLNKVERVGPSVFFTTNYIAFAKHVPDEVVRKWQIAFDELKASGKWQKIVDKYFPPGLPN